jgi:hypothetical protein
VTARRLLDDIVGSPNIARIIVCGTSQLTLALCSDLAHRQVERDYYTAPNERPLPRMTTVAPDAEEYQRDHENRQQQLGLTAKRQLFDAVAQVPSVRVLTELVSRDSGIDPTTVAFIFVDPDPIGGAAFDSTTATRLAARFRTSQVFAWEPKARVGGNRQTSVGQLRTYRLALHLPDDQAQDRWERAAMLIHSRYAAGVPVPAPPTRPWAQLDAFYQESNRRLVKHTLRMVEEIGEHTWNTWNSAVSQLASIPHDAEPLEQLRLMGFARDAAIAMARAEHEDWCRYYQDNGWKYGPKRDYENKLHEALLDWPSIEADPKLYKRALTTVAVTLRSLRELGYRSRPVWEQFERVGIVVAEQRTEAWTWTTETGETLTANAGDWEVREGAGGGSWSVRDDIFHQTYEHVDGSQWRRRGTVLARRARPGESIETLEGTVSAANGDWVIKGDKSELWPVPAEKFAQRYQRIETRSVATP